MEPISWRILICRIIILRKNEGLLLYTNKQKAKKYGDEIRKKLDREKIKYHSNYNEEQFEKFKKIYSYFFNFNGDEITVKSSVDFTYIHQTASICSDEMLNVMLDEEVIKKSGILKY